jgi:hypothetical protein
MGNIIEIFRSVKGNIPGPEYKPKPEMDAILVTPPTYGIKCVQK